MFTLVHNPNGASNDGNSGSAANLLPAGTGNVAFRFLVAVTMTGSSLALLGE